MLATAETVWAGDGLVNAYVDLRHDCITSGHPLGQRHHEADRWIAATARWLRLPLITHDDVFDDTPGLSIITEPA